MVKILKKFTFLFIPILILLYVIFCFNVIIQDWKYGPKDYNRSYGPYNWSKFFLEIKYKQFLSSFKISNKYVGLEPYYLYIAEKNHNLLTSDIPKSNKEWVPALVKKENKLIKVRLKLNGDNTNNLMLNKKSYRIKYRKKKRIDNTNEIILENVPSKYPDYWEYFISSRIASNLKVLVPDTKLVEVFLNDNSNGIYFHREHINEDFLRKKKIMPINIYKGEQVNLEKQLFLEQNLYNNPFLWKKTAYFNRIKKNDFSDLKNYLKFLKNSNNFNIFKEFYYLNSEIWSKFNVAQILTQNYSTDSYHNTRNAIDPWSGSIRPIFVEPVGLKLDENIFSFEKSTNQILLLFNQSSKFLHKKYILLNNSLKEEIYEKSINDLLSLEKKISISMERDKFLSEPFYTYYYNNKIKSDYLNVKKSKLLRENFYKKVIKRKHLLLEELSKEPHVTWFQHNDNKKKFEIYVDKKVPSCNLNINFKNNYNGKIILDENNNSKIDTNEIAFNINSNHAKIPICLYANRVKIKKEKKNLNRDAPYLTDDDLIKIIQTKFNFLLEREEDISEIYNENYFNKSKYKVKFLKPEKFSIQSTFNKAVLLDEKFQKKKIFSGIVEVNEDLTIYDTVEIKPGTKFIIEGNKNILFKNKVSAIGTMENKIIFKRKNSDYNWGAISIIGENTEKSIFKNILIDGGSGGKNKIFTFTGSLNLHNASDVLLSNIEITNHQKSDDVIHLVYSDNISLENIKIENAPHDAIDIDISNSIKIINSQIIKSGNDGIDFMESKATIKNSKISKSGDKGLSIGESSNINLDNLLIDDNNIGIAVKDASVAKLKTSILKNNKISIAAYKKNLHYNQGGNIYVNNSNIENNNSNTSFVIKNSSQLKLINSFINGIQQIDNLINKKNTQIEIN